MKQMTITSAEALGKVADAAPRRGNRATRVPAILEVAINVFATEGNLGFTQRRIASDAGIRLTTLQHYFSTREELLRATIEELARRSFERYMAIAKDKRRSPEARLDAIVDELFSVIAGMGTNVGAFAIEYWCLAEHEPFARVLLEKHTGEFQEILMGLVATINPTLSVTECTLRGAQILAHMYGLLVYIRQSGENTPDLDSFRHMTKVVWKALSKATQ
jgi:DNA-binding transcriptional regulator YbjK